MSSTIHFAEQTEDRSAGPARLLTLPTSVDGFVSFRGSLVAYPNLAAGDGMLQQLAVSMLDKGTEARDRFEVARVLEDRGAKLNLSSDGLYVDFSGQALTDDLTEVLDVLAEMLQMPLFDEAEFEKAQAQTIGQLQRSLERTSSRAENALTRSIFSEGHPNHRPRLERRIQQVQSATVEDVRAYHDAHFGATDFTVAVVGDLRHEDVADAVATAFSEWTPHDAAPAHDAEAPDGRPHRESLPMPDKSNVDVRLGHALPIRRDDDAYLPLYVGNYILGGNFAARLMTVVRDEKGLTYHVGSSLSGITTRYEGYFKTQVTLSHDRLDEGIEATEEVIRTFVDEGATEDELQAKKETITGSFTVGLSTTQRLAHSLLLNAERNFGVDYLDTFLDEVNALTIHDVNEAVRTHLRPDDLHVVAAGTRPEVVSV